MIFPVLLFRSIISHSFILNFENWHSRTTCSSVCQIGRENMETENTFSKFCITQHNHAQLCVPYVPNFEETGLSRSQKLTKWVQRPTPPHEFSINQLAYERANLTIPTILRFNPIFLGLLYPDILEKARKIWTFVPEFIYRIFFSFTFFYFHPRRRILREGREKNFDKNFTMAPAKFRSQVSNPSNFSRILTVSRSMFRVLHRIQFVLVFTFLYFFFVSIKFPPHRYSFDFKF